MSKHFNTIFKYNDDIIGKKITFLMSDITKQTHEKMFEDMLNYSNNKINEMIELENRVFQDLRYINIKNLYKDVIKCKLFVNYNFSSNKDIDFRSNNSDNVFYYLY